MPYRRVSVFVENVLHINVNIAIQRFISGRDASLESRINDYVASQARIQRLPTSAGLGEPKFYVNETVYTGTSK